MKDVRFREPLVDQLLYPFPRDAIPLAAPPEARQNPSRLYVFMSGRRAQQCLEVAPTFNSRVAQDILLQMAQVWLRLAENYQDANEMVGRSKAPEEEARPVVQQQQQIPPKPEDEE